MDSSLHRGKKRTIEEGKTTRAPGSCDSIAPLETALLPYAYHLPVGIE